MSKEENSVFLESKLMNGTFTYFLEKQRKSYREIKQFPQMIIVKVTE